MSNIIASGDLEGIGISSGVSPEHSNRSILDNFGQSGSGLPTYNGNAIDTTIAQRDVYDGLDSNNNAISLSASQGKILQDTKVDNTQVLTSVPAGAVFTDTVFDPSSFVATLATKLSKVAQPTYNPTGVAYVTQAEYDALTPTNNVVYHIVEV